jgi:hypothetical protein
MKSRKQDIVVTMEVPDGDYERYRQQYALIEFGGVSGPNGQLTLTQNRLNIGRQLEENAAAIHGVPDLESAIVLKTLDAFKTKREKVEEKLSPDSRITDPVWQELRNLREDLKRALAVLPHL